MAITQKSMKILWANAAGRCAFPDCREKLSFAEAGKSAPHTIGEMAHIRGEKPGANRHDPGQSPAERDAYENLILLCPNHHTLIDRPENEEKFPVEMLLDLKREHEAYVDGLLTTPDFTSKAEVAAHVYPLVAENHEVFVNFGPHSEIARKNPGSDAHGVWLSERLGTIIPNNRQMLNVLEQNRGLFDPDEQAVLAMFSVHVRTYDSWVMDEISYEGVVPFPPDYAALIKELADASL